MKFLGGITRKKILVMMFALVFVGIAGMAVLLTSISANLPQIMKVEDYKPLLVSEVYARGGEKIGEYYRENRIIVPIEKIPKLLIFAFTSAEDDTFYQHGGINYLAILRATVANLKAGHTVQGGSTITQQVAKSLLLSPEKTLDRKIKEAMLAYRMEEHLSKQDIIYLYLNQIYFGEGAYGVGSASQTYFRKTVDQLTIAEMAILAGLPQAPSRYSPVDHPLKAKERQRYVLGRMRATGHITEAEEKKALAEPITVYIGKEYKQVGPYFVETVRQLLVQLLGEDAVLDQGLKVYTSLDYKYQQDAQNELRAGLREIDKRQGFRGASKHITTDEELKAFLLAGRKEQQKEKALVRVIAPDGNVMPEKPITVFHKKDAQDGVVSNLPDYLKKDQILEAYVSKIYERWGLAEVRFGEVQALLDIGDMGWARKPDASIRSDAAPKPTKIAQLLKVGDVVQVKIAGDKFASQRLSKELGGAKKGKAEMPKDLPVFAEYAYVLLDQDPLVEGALISLDQSTQDVIALAGGYDFKRSEYNRALQAARQTGSSFKAIVYASAFDKGFTAASPVADTPVVFEEKDTEAEEGQDDVKKYKPHNFENKFLGDILFRNALIRSLNIPTVKILTEVGVDWATQYARRLGIYSPLSNDITLGLGSSSVTLYEMTRAFAHFGRLGKRVRPIVIRKVTDHQGKPLLQNIELDKRIEKELAPIEKNFEDKRQELLTANLIPERDNDPTLVDPAVPNKHRTPNIYFKDPDQVLAPQTAYLATSILSGVINDEGGTAARARALGRPAAGKTGTTNGFYDTWFVGYTPQIIAGVWVGFDQEKSIGMGETGAKTALPIWLEYMKKTHEDLPVQSFTIPDRIVFANIDNQTGKLASASSRSVVRQAFLQGTEPATLSDSISNKSDADLLKEDLSE